MEPYRFSVETGGDEGWVSFHFKDFCPEGTAVPYTGSIWVTRGGGIRRFSYESLHRSDGKPNRNLRFAAKQSFEKLINEILDDQGLLQ